MRAIRRIAVTCAVVITLMGTVAAGVASAKANGSATAADGTELAFHGSSAGSKSGGGFEAYDSPKFDYISGKVDCYIERGNAAAFTSRIAKSIDPRLIGRWITFWVSDNPDRFDYLLDTNECSVRDAGGLQSLIDGYITIK